MIHLTIMNPRETLFDDQVSSVVVPGDLGDFEILSYHKPLISLLRRGRFVLDGKHVIEVARGIVRVHHDRIVALVEQ